MTKRNTKKYKKYLNDIATSGDHRKTYLITTAWKIANDKLYTKRRKGLELELLYKAYENVIKIRRD